MLELRRMAVRDDCPANTASRMIGYMRRWINKEMPSIACLISYQDTEVHAGTIYKASGWSLADTSKAGFLWSLNGRSRSLEQSTAPKIRWEYALRDYVDTTEVARAEQIKLDI